jgi:hypothetical protein
LVVDCLFWLLLGRNAIIFVKIIAKVDLPHFCIINLNLNAIHHVIVYFPTLNFFPFALHLFREIGHQQDSPAGAEIGYQSTTTPLPFHPPNFKAKTPRMKLERGETSPFLIFSSVDGYIG